MQKILMGCLLLLILAVGCVKPNAPAVQFDGTRYLFGEVVQGEEVVFTFSFKNTGNMTLHIEELSVSCYCVVIKNCTKSVAPGEKGQVYGVLETKDFVGDMYRAIEVKTNIPKSEPIMLVLEGVILAKPTT